MTTASFVRLARHESALGRWETATRGAEEALAAVALGWSGFRGAMHVTRELHLPSGLPALVVNLGAPFLVNGGNDAAAHCCVDISVMGVHARPFVTDTPVARDLMVLNLTPVGAHRLFGAPMDALADRWVQLADLVGPPARSLSDRLRAVGDWEQRFAVVEAFLAARLGSARASRRDLAPTWRWMSAGQGGVAALADRLGVSHKHLIVEFRREVGIPPKLVGRLGRFNRALRLGRTPRLDWAQLAHACGYFDQAHMINEFNDFAGMTPSALKRRVAAFTLRAEPAG